MPRLARSRLRSRLRSLSNYYRRQQQKTQRRRRRSTPLARGSVPSPANPPNATTRSLALALALALTIKLLPPQQQRQQRRRRRSPRLARSRLRSRLRSLSNYNRRSSRGSRDADADHHDSLARACAHYQTLPEAAEPQIIDDAAFEEIEDANHERWKTQTMSSDHVTLGVGRQEGSRADQVGRQEGSRADQVGRQAVERCERREWRPRVARVLRRW